MTKGVISAMITGVDIIPVPADYKSIREAGTILISFNQKKKCQMAIIAGKKKLQRCILIRQAIPEEGIDLMAINFGSNIYNVRDLTRFPGSLCKSFGITPGLDGLSIINSDLFIANKGAFIDPSRIAILEVRKGRWRYFTK